MHRLLLAIVCAFIAGCSVSSVSRLLSRDPELRVYDIVTQMTATVMGYRMAYEGKKPVLSELIAFFTMSDRSPMPTNPYTGEPVHFYEMNDQGKPVNGATDEGTLYGNFGYVESDDGLTRMVFWTKRGSIVIRLDWTPMAVHDSLRVGRRLPSLAPPDSPEATPRKPRSTPTTPKVPKEKFAEVPHGTSVFHSCHAAVYCA